MLDKKFFLKIAPNVVSRYRQHIFGTKSGGKGAKDVYGSSYPVYKDGGVQKKKGTGNRQASKYKDSRAPVFTGDLLKDFQLTKTSSRGFVFGTKAWGGKVKSLAKQGRVISTDEQPVPKDVLEYIFDEAEKYTKRKLKMKIKGGKIIIR